jgi:corrinoid protein of di/trimethylamine methyltransferase
MTLLEKLYGAILNGDNTAAVEIVREALDEGVDPGDLIDQGMIPAMREAGQRFEEEDFFVPELLLAAHAMKAGLELIRPLLAERGIERKGCMVIGTVQGDLHDIGKNLVSSMLEGAGFEIVDLGADVPPERFVDAVKENNADLLGLSALLTVTMTAMKTTIDALEKAGLRDGVKVLVGGAPLSAEYASEIGADGYASNASAAVRVAQGFAGG